MKETFTGEDGMLHCKVCGESTENIVPFPLLDGSGRTEERKVPRSCKCERDARDAYRKHLEFQEKQSEIMKLRNLSLMDAKLCEVTFATYKKTQDNTKALNLAVKYVERFDEMYEKGQGLLFWGDVGTGKSYTAAVIANELLNRQVPVIMTSFIKLLSAIGNFDKEDEEYISRLNKAKLLIIDDLGAERGTDFALEKVYDIIDSRYRTGKPIVLTTNLRLPDMQNCSDIRYNRIYDRIFEMCYPVQMTGVSWRKKDAAARFDNMKKILEG